MGSIVLRLCSGQSGGFGDGAVAVTEERSDLRVAEHCCTVIVRVEDARRHHEHARERGARIIASPTDYSYGERQYTAEDLGGHRWTFSESIADVAPEDWGGTSLELS
jgi:uncharacterized glyoxalase superfamily protein PhnB